MANICCSIELEPRTLNQGQLNQAREVAVQNLEASALFVEEMDNEGEKLLECTEKEKARFADDKNCQCSCIAESPRQFDLKQPHSAPF
ncbi:hypothetical protein L6164_021504 [Bauhinia variegata]|uniref:Uncharacterized protein n=1 Tax=Bauhinia variegata TaxID=167791 RepID=A0ACB9MZY9_BAUVA|nr:hypothetical protein L6164_021504 [Bauhinia variegata]